MEPLTSVHRPQYARQDRLRILSLWTLHLFYELQIFEC